MIEKFEIVGGKVGVSVKNVKVWLSIDDSGNLDLRTDAGKPDRGFYLLTITKGGLLQRHDLSNEANDVFEFDLNGYIKLEEDDD